MGNLFNIESKPEVVKSREATRITTQEPVSIVGQFGICGIFASLLWWAIAKTIPQISADNRAAAEATANAHKEAAGIITEKLSQVQAEIRAGNDSQLALLRNVVQQNRQQ